MDGSGQAVEKRWALCAVGPYVIVRPDVVEEMRGIVIPQMSQALTSTGVITVVGDLVPQLDLVVGARVVFGRHDGVPCEIDGDITNRPRVLHYTAIRAVIYSFEEGTDWREIRNAVIAQSKLRVQSLIHDLQGILDGSLAPRQIDEIHYPR